MKLGERITVTIDRNKWARVVQRAGAKSACDIRDGSVNRTDGQWPSLLSDTGTMCCLGFISKALLLKSGMAEDVADRVLLDRSMPSSIGGMHTVYWGMAASRREQVDKALELLRKPLSPNSEGGSAAWLNSELAKVAASVNDLSVPDSSAPEFLCTREEGA